MVSGHHLPQTFLLKSRDTKTHLAQFGGGCHIWNVNFRKFCHDQQVSFETYHVHMITYYEQNEQRES